MDISSMRTVQIHRALFTGLRLGGFGKADMIGLFFFWTPVPLSAHAERQGTQRNLSPAACSGRMM
jgi:hypothetical protein